MTLRIAKTRFKTEWKKLIVIAGFIVIYIWHITSQIPSVSYTSFMERYGSLSPRAAASALDAYNGQENLTMDDVYEIYVHSNRDFFYTKPIDNSILAVFAMGPLLATMMICSLFGGRRVSLFLQSGASRTKIFLSLTAGFYIPAILIWLAVSSIVRYNYSISFSPEEQGYFIFTYLSWLVMVLACISLAFALAFIFKRALPTVLLSLLIEFSLLFISPFGGKVFPSNVLLENAYWRPDADMALLRNADIVSAVIIVCALIVSYLCFVKRGQK